MKEKGSDVDKSKSSSRVSLKVPDYLSAPLSFPSASASVTTLLTILSVLSLDYF